MITRRDALILLGAAAIGFSAIQGAAQEPKVKSTPLPTASGFCKSDGLDIYFETYGTGRPIILVHGWGSSIKGNWIDTGWVATLQPHRRVIALDVRGHGRSDKPHEQQLYSYAAMANDVLAVMDHLELTKADYLGYSMGAFMGAYLLGRQSKRFSSMIMGGIGDETPRSARACEAIAEALRAEDPAKIKSPLGLAYRSYAKSDPNNDLEALALSALQMWPEGHPIRLGGPGLEQATVPTLIVNGANDHPYVDSDEKFAAVIRNAQLVRIPRANHLSAIPHPEFKKAVVAFLERHAPAVD